MSGAAPGPGSANGAQHQSSNPTPDMPSSQAPGQSSQGSSSQPPPRPPPGNAQQPPPGPAADASNAPFAGMPGITLSADEQRRILRDGMVMSTAIRMMLGGAGGIGEAMGGFLTDLRGAAQSTIAANEKRSDLDGWSIRDIGYFHPDLDSVAVGTSDVVTIGKEVHWRSVYLFIQQVRAQRNSPAKTDQITKKFPQLLRGRAQLWWTSVVSDEEHEKCLNDNEHALSLLYNEFKTPTYQAMESWRQARYTKDDCLKGQDFKDWGMNLARSCRALNMVDPTLLNLTIYNSVDHELRVILAPPEFGIKFDEYLSYVNDRVRSWRDKLIAQGAKVSTPSVQDLSMNTKNMSINERLIRNIPVTAQSPLPPSRAIEPANHTSEFEMMFGRGDRNRSGLRNKGRDFNSRINICDNNRNYYQSRDCNGGCNGDKYYYNCTKYNYKGYGYNQYRPQTRNPFC
ncbi:hypothetical protein F4805DRAFT_474657 [Annulohypoxylon moriforme]|nr:hypothetical protein F4805DRAFT_474657 [Annulohypoxylon moriforme]